MESEISQIVRLYIPWFGKERFYLIYQKTNEDHVLLNITGKNKGDDSKISQHPLKDENIKLPGYEEPLVNLNSLVFIENDFFFELFRKVKQLEEIIKLSEREFRIINKKVGDCFSNEIFSGNLYELRVLPNITKKFNNKVS